MSIFLLFIAAELFMAAAAQRRIHARVEIIKKWKRGELSMDELLYLKTRPWFRKLFPMAKLKECVSKKED